MTSKYAKKKNSKFSRSVNVCFQKLSIPPPWRVIGNSKGEGGSKMPKFLKEGMSLNWNFQKGGGQVKG